MELEGVVENGVIVPEEPCALPEGTRVRFEAIDEAEFPENKLPPDHPDASYHRETELAILRESIEEMNSGGGRPWREVMQELSHKHGLEPRSME